MKPNLDSLKTEIEHRIEELGLAVFYGHSRAREPVSGVYWDCEEFPDFRLFLKAAVAAGAKLIVYHQHELAAGEIEETLELLGNCDVPRDEYREYELRLNSMRPHYGSVCEIELSFDLEGRVFLFDLRTDWYDELSDIQDEIRILSAEADDQDDTPLSGYFSKN